MNHASGENPQIGNVNHSGGQNPLISTVDHSCGQKTIIGRVDHSSGENPQNGKVDHLGRQNPLIAKVDYSDGQSPSNGKVNHSSGENPQIGKVDYLSGQKPQQTMQKLDGKTFETMQSIQVGQDDESRDVMVEVRDLNGKKIGNSKALLNTGTEKSIADFNFLCSIGRDRSDLNEYRTKRLVSKRDYGIRIKGEDGSSLNMGFIEEIGTINLKLSCGGKIVEDVITIVYELLPVPIFIGLNAKAALKDGLTYPNTINDVHLVGLEDQPDQINLQAKISGLEDQADQTKPRYSKRRKKAYSKLKKMTSDLYIGQGVEVEDEENQQWNKLGTVVRIGENQQYMIEMGLSRIWHHRKFLRPIGQEQTYRDDDWNGGETTWRKPPNHLRQVTFKEDTSKMVNRQTEKENGDVIQEIIWNEEEEELIGIQDVFG